jgi:hypothetical protein
MLNILHISLNKYTSKTIMNNNLHQCIKQILEITALRLPDICLTGSVAIRLLAEKYKNKQIIELLNELPLFNDFDFLISRNDSKTNDFYFKLNKSFGDITYVLPNSSIKSASHVIRTKEFAGVKFDLTLVNKLHFVCFVFNGFSVNVLLPETLLLYYDDEDEITNKKRELLKLIIKQKNIQEIGNVLFDESKSKKRNILFDSGESDLKNILFDSEESDLKKRKKLLFY